MHADPRRKTDPSAPPSALSTTRTTQNEAGRDQVPRLPGKNEGR